MLEIKISYVSKRTNHSCIWRFQYATTPFFTFEKCSWIIKMNGLIALQCWYEFFRPQWPSQKASLHIFCVDILKTNILLADAFHDAIWLYVNVLSAREMFRSSRVRPFYRACIVLCGYCIYLRYAPQSYYCRGAFLQRVKFILGRAQRNRLLPPNRCVDCSIFVPHQNACPTFATRFLMRISIGALECKQLISPSRSNDQRDILGSV